MKKVVLIHGPNLNMTGIREQGVYGAETLDDINQWLLSYAKEKGIELSILQSNSEGEIIDAIHRTYGKEMCIRDRVIPVAALTGEAAGRAAAMSVQSGLPVSDIDVSSLQERLKRNGVLFI